MYCASMWQRALSKYGTYFIKYLIITVGMNINNPMNTMFENFKTK